MYDVMEGIKVIEVAEHTFVPAAAMILADWGADVIKIERAAGGGDPGRNLAIPNSGKDGLSMYFEAGNRGKRSLALDLTKPEGRALRRVAANRQCAGDCLGGEFVSEAGQHLQTQAGDCVHIVLLFLVAQFPIAGLPRARPNVVAPIGRRSPWKAAGRGRLS